MVYYRHSQDRLCPITYRGPEPHKVLTLTPSERASERERERERERQTDRERERDRERETETETERQRDRETQRERERGSPVFLSVSWLKRVSLHSPGSHLYIH